MIGGHGHVTPRPDGAKARCGGPGLCTTCSREQVAQCQPAPVTGARLKTAIRLALVVAAANEGEQESWRWGWIGRFTDTLTDLVARELGVQPPARTSGCPGCPVCSRPVARMEGSAEGVRYWHQGPHILGDTPCWTPVTAPKETP